MKKLVTVGDLCWCGNFKGSMISGDWKNVSGTTFTLTKCDNCGTIRTSMCEFDDYEEAVYLGKISISERHKNSIDTIKKYCIGKTLDIGCNCGEILNELRKDKAFADLVGIDANEKAVLLGIETYNLNLKNVSIDDLLIETQEKDKYDNVIIVHTFEHIPNPVQFLQKIKGLFKSYGEGLLYICVPNIENVNIFKFGALDPREHYWHFSQHTFTSLVKYALPDAEIIFSGKSDIWGNKEQLEFIIKMEGQDK
jgi:SAM-dependent methyltransferase